MALYFLDTSALVKRYVLETGTAWVQSLTSPTTGHSLFISRITQVETISAVIRRVRGGPLTARDSSTVLSDFGYDLTLQYRIIEISTGVINQAAILVERHALRAYDAVQLSSAFEMRKQAPSLVLVSADAELNASAASEHLLVDNPNIYPEPPYWSTFYLKMS